MEGYRSALKKNGLSFEAGLVITGDYTERSGYNAVKELLKEKKSFTAIFAASDLMAIGAIKALTESGIRVPHDIAVIGFDDIFFAEYSNPRLTTVRQHKFELGYQGARQLHKIIEDSDYAPVHKKIDVELIIRESV